MAEAEKNEKKSSDKKEAKKKNLKRDVATIGALALLVFSARSSFADHYVVPSGSMRPTVEIGDRIFVNKLAYGLHIPFASHYLIQLDQPARGDVVVLDSPVEDVTLLKRVVAIPNDKVEVRAGRLLINDAEVKVEEDPNGIYEALGAEPHPIRLTNGGGPALGPVEVPHDKYLVLGDNRGESADGRFFGLVERDRLRGRAVAIYWHDSGLAWKKL